MSTTLSPTAEAQALESVITIEGFADEMRAAIEKGKRYLDGGMEPEDAEGEMTAAINARHNLVSAEVGALSKPAAQAVAAHYGVHHLKKETSTELGRKVAAHVYAMVTVENDVYDEIKKAARGVRRRVEGVAMADRVLRYWAALDGDSARVWRNWSPETVLEGLRYYGQVYLHCSGEESDAYTEPLDQNLTIEQALRRTGNVALNHLLSGGHRGINSESSIMQMRVGDLEGYLRMEVASRTIVMLTHGNLDIDQYGDDGVRVPAEGQFNSDLVPYAVQYGRD